MDGLEPRHMPGDIDRDIVIARGVDLRTGLWCALYTAAGLAVMGLLPGPAWFRIGAGAAVTVGASAAKIMGLRSFAQRLRAFLGRRRRIRLGDAPAARGDEEAVPVRAVHGVCVEFESGYWAVVLRIEPLPCEFATDSRLLALQTWFGDVLDHLHGVGITGEVWVDVEPDLARAEAGRVQALIDALPPADGLRTIGEARLRHHGQIARRLARRTVYHLRLVVEARQALQHIRPRPRNPAETHERLPQWLLQQAGVVMTHLRSAGCRVAALAPEAVRDTAIQQLDLSTWLMVDPPEGTDWAWAVGEDLPPVRGGSSELAGVEAAETIPPVPQPVAPAPSVQEPLPQPVVVAPEPDAAVTTDPVPALADRIELPDPPDPGEHGVAEPKGSRLRAVGGLLRDLGQRLRRERGPSPLTLGAPWLQQETIAIVGARPGQGATALATNLAMVCRLSGHEAALVTLDGGRNDAAAALGIHLLVDSYTWAEEPSAVLVRGPKKLWVVPGPSVPGAEPPDEASIARVLGVLRRQCQAVVVDLGATWGSEAQAVIRQATTVLVVVTPDLQAVRDLGTVLERLRLLGYPPESVGVVLNRVSAEHPVPRDLHPVLILPEDPLLMRCQYAGTIPALRGTGPYHEALARWLLAQRAS